ncbi:hypothetical protein DLR11_03190 [Salmonella enterica subsp. salamae]|nr:hypothetical protein [Salmonella enterica subsp. salamae]
MAMRLSVRWKKDRILQFRLVLFSGRRSTVAITIFRLKQKTITMLKLLLKKTSGMGNVMTKIGTLRLRLSSLGGLKYGWETK